MKKLGEWSIKNHVTVNLIMVFIIVAGLLTVLKMRREIFPQFALDMIVVSVDYPGSSPEEVEEGICIKVEEQIEGIEGIDRIISTAREGNGEVLVELKSGRDVSKVLDEIKAEVDRIDTFPAEAEEPLVLEIIERDPTIYIAAFGDVPERHLRQAAEKIRDDLLDARIVSQIESNTERGFLSALRFKQPEVITQIELVGVRDYEIAVEVSEDNLRRYGLTFAQVVSAVQAGSIDLPGGRIKTDQGEILVRSKGQLYVGEEFEAIPLITLADGTVVRLGQVATVIDGFADLDIKARFNGKPAAVVRISRTSEQDIVEIADIARKYVAAHDYKMNSDIDLAIWGDLSVLVRDRIDLMLRNGAQGITLVFIALALFLNFRLAFWVAIGIPISFMGAFLVLNAFGQTVNMISLFAFIMTLGILVDDAIIVGENIYTHSNRGKSPPAAVIDGLKEVGGPVVMAVSTTVVAFLPLMFIAGIMGKFIAVMPMAVIIILIVSLGEALIILPAHLHNALLQSDKKKVKDNSWLERLRKRVERLLQDTIHRVYTPAINYVVKNRYFTLSIGIGVLIISLGIVAGGYVPFVFFPKGESDWLIAEINYPLGTPISLTETTIQDLENKAFDLNTAFPEFSEKNGDLVQNTFALVGLIPRRDWKPPEFGSHVGEVWVELVSSGQRPGLSTNDILNRWRSLVGELPGVDRLAFLTLEGGPAGNAIEIQLSGKDFDQLSLAADELKKEIETYPGTYDISDDFKPGKQEKKLRVKPGARSIGVTMRGLARQVRQAFYGEEVLRIQRGREDVKVMVRYADQQRSSLSGFDEMRIRTEDGREIPIEEVADITHGRAYSIIHRVDRKRTVTVISDIDENTANASQIVADLKADFLPRLAERYPGVSFDLEGQAKRTGESVDSMQSGYLLAMMGIFLLLASQFRSYIQPVIIMTAIPFGLIGAIFGHLVMGKEFTIVSLFGIVALSGIVVNDALILIDFINRAVRSGVDVETAVVQSGKARFRPVLLTSITTIAGLLPILLERSFQAQFLIPMAISICFGLLAATVLTLLYVPALYLIVRDVRNVLIARFKRAELAPHPSAAEGQMAGDSESMMEDRK
ncbi:MAG: efflux RND transporter permease subunit [Deltaproteobacteria bacterium]|jgi:multidrug efflux pump subunit AcrB|nr:efflux RND transporter permease subunit [Deltaproteobacteria bacterium]